ncbi:HNH endonuclease signature motif containing protein [Methylorubrum rhodesianum]|uniref:HNH endonuclease signature motif containing protein n=1 Tax=Methylorubrum rhodesianum TaxID=29427 RepID=UPI003D2B8CB6
MSPVAPKGSLAGSIHKFGYRLIGISGRQWRGHQLAWLLMTGLWPKHQIDHIDGNRANNAWRNLRAASRSENARNRSVGASTKSGYKGVYPHVTGGYVAKIRFGGRGVHLGCFADRASAAAAYDQAAREAFGSFAALNFPRPGEVSCHRRSHCSSLA